MLEAKLNVMHQLKKKKKRKLIPYHETHPIDLFIFVPFNIATHPTANEMLILTKEQLVIDKVLANDKGCKVRIYLHHSCTDK